MTVTAEQMHAWCGALLGTQGRPDLTLEEYVAQVQGVDALADLPSGTRILIRGDVDAKVGASIGDGDIRLRSMAQTLAAGRDRGWIQVVFGHIGRKPEGSLDKVAKRLGELLKCEVPLVEDWLDEGGLKVTGQLTSALERAQPGDVLVLQNTRKYDIERVLWKAGADELAELAPKLSRFANELADKVADVFIHEALSAGSLDSSSVVVPAAMQRTALGSYARGEFQGPMLRCRQAKLVVFSGLKIDKLDDLESIVHRGEVKLVIAAGSLAMALLKARAAIEGRAFSIGVSESSEHAAAPYYIPPARIEQAQQLLQEGQERGVEFVMPVDFVLADGSVAEKLGPGDQQLDVGPASRQHFAEAVGRFIDQHQSDDPPAVAFHNGVFGKFEEDAFAGGTRDFVQQLKRMTDAGVDVYVGGGEGGAALERYGQPDWVQHVFTAGGTVLNALGPEPVPYLLALYLQQRGA